MNSEEVKVNLLRKCGAAYFVPLCNGAHMRPAYYAIVRWRYGKVFLGYVSFLLFFLYWDGVSFICDRKALLNSFIDENPHSSASRDILISVVQRSLSA